MPDATHDQDPGRQSRKRLFRRVKMLDRTPPQALVRGCLFLGWSAPRRPLFRVKHDTRAPQVGWGFGKAWLGMVGIGQVVFREAWRWISFLGVGVWNGGKRCEIVQSVKIRVVRHEEHERY